MALLIYAIADYLLLVFFIPRYANGILTIKPKDTEVIVGQSTYFNCSTSLYQRDVQWQYYAVGATAFDRKYIYAFGKLYPPYDNKVRIDNNISTGVWNLVLHNVTSEDAGRYVCQDDGGIGETKEAQLVVLATDPVCDSNIAMKSVVGPNDCGVAPDELVLSCSVSYNGNANAPPILQWKSSRNNDSLGQNVTIQNTPNIVTYNLTMKANLQINGSFFYCETTRSTSSQYNCTSAVIDVLYVFNESSTVNQSVHVGDKIECSVNKSKDLVCGYKWKWIDADDITTESHNSILKPIKSGLHRCEASCDIKEGLPCNIHVMRVYASSRENSENVTSAPTTKEHKDSSSSSPAAIAVPIVVVLLLIIVAVLIGICVRKRTRHRKNEVVTHDTRTNVLYTRNDDDVDESTPFNAPPNANGGQPGEQSGPDTTHELGWKQKLVLEVNNKVLVELIDSSKLLDRLYSAGLIKKKQRREIASKPTELERAQMLAEIVIQILNQGKKEDYRKVKECLRDTRHNNVGEVLEKGEVVVRVHSQMCDYLRSDKTSEIEDNMVTNLTKYTLLEMSELESAEIDRLLEETKSNIIAARRGGSVVLYVSLAMMKNLRNLEAELESGKLKNAIQRMYEKMIELLIGKLNPSPVEITVTIRLHDGDLDNAKSFFQETDSTKGKEFDSDYANAEEISYITPQSVVATEDQWEKVIRTNFNYLVEKIDAGNDFYGALKMLDIFTNIQLKRFWTHERESKRITLMLVCLERKDFNSFKKFCVALEKSDQGHIVQDYLSVVKEPSTKPDSAVDDPDAYRPIAFYKAQCLIKNYTELLNQIHFGEELLTRLGERNTFTQMTFTDLKETTDTIRRGHMILDKLVNGSEKQYKNFCEALEATKQSHIVVELLTPHADHTKSRSQPSGEQSLAQPSGEQTRIQQPSGEQSRSQQPSGEQTRIQQPSGEENRSQPSREQTITTQKPDDTRKGAQEMVMAKEDKWEEVIRSNFNELVNKIEATEDFQGALMNADIFTSLQLKRFWNKKLSSSIISQILHSLQKKDFDSFKKFCAALVKSSQSHIVRDYLSVVKEPSANPDSDTGDSDACRPISSDKALCLKRKYAELLNAIQFEDELLDLLKARSTFTTIAHNNLRETEDHVERGKIIFSKLENGSEKQFSDFCGALKTTKQWHIVATLLKPPTEKSISFECNGFSQCSDEFLERLKEEVTQKKAYKCDSTPVGRAIIINNQYFDPPNLTDRDGAEKDSENLKSLFKLLGFFTIIHANQTAKEMKTILTQESKEKCHKDYDMLVLFLLSHGDKGKIYGSDGETVETAYIFSLFDGNNCPNLVEKPKIIFIQACQGSQKTTGATADFAVNDGPKPEDGPMSGKGNVVEKIEGKEDSSTCIPLELPPNFQSDAIADKVHEKADMAVFYATVEGYVAWRRRDRGSVFVECLTTVLTQNAHKSDLMSMATEIFDELHKCNVQEDGKAPQKQIGEKRDTLRRKVYLLPRQPVA